LEFSFWVVWASKERAANIAVLRSNGISCLDIVRHYNIVLFVPERSESQLII
jgi:hypothetical protein